MEKKTTDTVIKPKRLYKGFNKGMGNLRVADKERAQAELMSATGLASLSNFYGYRDGRTPVRAWQRDVIEAVFAKYGVKGPENIWDA